MSDRHTTRSVKNSVVLTGLSVLIILLLLNSSAHAQYSRTIHDGYTPTGVEEGAAAGSYPLSGFENINLYNGMLNIAYPLVRIGGRGSAGYTMTLKTDNHWEVYQYGDPIAGIGVLDEAQYAAGRSWRVGYGPGVLLGMHAANRTFPPESPCGPPPLTNYYPIQYLTRLTFIMPDGSEVLLHDKVDGGFANEVNWCTPPQTARNRGRVFVSADGESMTFISDGDIVDELLTSQLTFEFLPSGTLMMQDGTRYRIDNGRVSWIRDRSGNKISLTYETLTTSTWRLLTVTDSLNRVVSVSYATTSPGYDEISFKGFGGAQRSIKVWYDRMENILYPGQTIKKANQLFPLEICSPGDAWAGDWDMNGTVLSKIELPDQRTSQFLYNSYGEIARIILPTGGGFDYEHSASACASGGACQQNVYGLMIYRRVTKRTDYNTLTPTTDPNNPPAGTREKIENYFVETPGGTQTVVRVEVRDGANILTAQSKHYFYGNPLFSGDTSKTPVCYSWWAAGKEHKTESFNVSGGTAGAVLRTSDQIWSPTVGGGSEALCYGIPDPNPKIAEIINTLSDTNQVAKQTFSYDQYNNQTDTWEYDFGTGSPGPLLRHTKTQYLTSGYDTVSGTPTNPNAAATIHIRNLPTSQAVYSDAGTSNKMAETVYEYDDYTTPDGYHAQLGACTGISGLCEGTPQNCPNGPNFTDSNPTTSYKTRGNVTKVSHWLNTGSAVNTYQQYDVAGNVVKTIDAKGNATQFDFRDNFGSPDGAAQSGDNPLNTQPPELSATSQSAYAYPFKVTNALGHKSYTQFDYYLGKPVDFEDPNGVTTGFLYEDTLDRQTKLIRGLGGAGVFLPEAVQTLVIYNDGDDWVGGNPPHSITTIIDKDFVGESNSGVGIKSLALYDGFGRTWRNASYEGPTGSGNTWLVTDTQFDALGRMKRVSNPFRLTAPDGALPENVEWKTTEYDALSRVKTVTTHDGAFVTTTYSGNSVTVEDQHDPEDPDPAKQVGRKRRSETDALGRLTKVTEDPDAGGLNYDTTYFYNALGNLLKVAQGSQRRWFAYDSLSRLIRARNPEQSTFNFTFTPPQSTVTVNAGGESNSDWSAAYVYDPNGNLLKKKSVTGPSGSPTEIETSYLYDTLNRNTQTAYSSYPNGSFFVDRFYDGATKGKGRFWYDIAYNYRWEKPTDNLAYHHNKMISYDALGRPLNQQQNFIVLEGGSWQYKPFSLSRTYDLAGNVKTQTYPSNRTVNYSYDTAGRPNSFKGKLGGVTGPGGTDVNYTTDIQYNAYGLMKRETYGTQSLLYHNMHYNNRLQMVDFRVGNSSTDEWNYSLGAIAVLYGRAAVDGWAMFANCKDNNGNAVRQLHYAPLAGGGDVITQRDDYTYDALNRIKSVTENQRNQSGQWTPTPVFTQAFLYDRWGNRTIDMAATTPSVPGVTRKDFVVDSVTNRMTSVDGCTMTYDAAGNQTYDCVGNHYYDSENRMTKAVQGGQNHYYFYDANGKRVRRILNGSGTWNGQETWFVYGFDGELVAEYTYNQVTAPLPGAPQKEYGYRGGKMLVVWDGSQAGDDALKWLVSDHLGSTRWEINKSGSLGGTRRHDYLPFGEELVASTGAQRSGVGYEPPASSVKQKFGSKERDNETGLDYFLARYYSSTQGRFTSPDEYTGGPTQLFVEVAAHNPTFYADILEPQSLNKYTYCLNNPLKFVDPDGHQYEVADRLRNAQAIVQNAVNDAKKAVKDTASAVGKSVANAVIDIVHFGEVGVDDAGRQVYEYNRYEPSNELQAAVMHTTDKLVVLGGLLGGRVPVNVAMAEGTGAAIVAAEAGAANTANAARRAAMREAGIPTSQQPLPASQQIGPRTTAQGKNYEYDVAGKGRMAVQQTAKPKPNEPHGPHWEAGRVKPAGQTDSLGRPRLRSDKSRVEYEQK